MPFHVSQSWTPWYQSRGSVVFLFELCLYLSKSYVRNGQLDEDMLEAFKSSLSLYHQQVAMARPWMGWQSTLTSSSKTTAEMSQDRSRRKMSGRKAMKRHAARFKRDPCQSCFPHLAGTCLLFVFSLSPLLSWTLLVAPSSRWNATLSLLHPLDRYRTPSAMDCDWKAPSRPT